MTACVMFSFWDPRQLSAFPPLLVRQRKSGKHSVLIDPGEDVGCFSRSTLRHLSPKLLRPRKAANDERHCNKGGRTRSRPPLRFRDNNRAFYFSVSQGHERFLTTDTKRRKMRADCVGDIGRGQVRVVLFGHPRVRMTELRGDDTQANTLHRQVACMSMTQHMKSHRR